MPQGAYAVELKSETVEAFDRYVRQAEAGMGSGSFLWSDASPERAGGVRRGEIAAESWPGPEPVAAPHGLIHDWTGALFATGTTLKKTLALVQDYDNHKKIYRAEVLDSRLISRRGDDFQIFLRLLKKKILTVILDTDHEVHYGSLDRARWFCRSYTTRICEVENAGKPNEEAWPPGQGYGFLWRLYSYWRFEERDGGVYIECRAISLTRDVPAALRWIIQPMVRHLPRESLVNTLKATREALRA